jgi:hypothetical protein
MVGLVKFIIRDRLLQPYQASQRPVFLGMALFRYWLLGDSLLGRYKLSFVNSSFAALRMTLGGIRHAELNAMKRSIFFGDDFLV